MLDLLLLLAQLLVSPPAGQGPTAEPVEEWCRPPGEVAENPEQKRGQRRPAPPPKGAEQDRPRPDEGCCHDTCR